MTVSQGSTNVELRLASPDPRIAKHGEEDILSRSIAAEVRSAFTYATIAQLAYDMGQIERGDEAFARSQEACSRAYHAAKSTSESARQWVCVQLEALEPAFEACRRQVSNFHPVLRQPSRS